MTVASGQMPYQYDVPLPLSADTALGLSGIHIESAQFVINAELRKFTTSNSITQLWELFTHPDIAPSGYEPKADGSTLGGCVGQVAQVALDNIARLRNVLIDGLFREYEDFSEFDYETMARDWIQRAYPTSPSGYNFQHDRAFFLRPILQADGSTYFPSIFSGDDLTGDLVEADPHWLGGSGIIMDIDVGEVMFNPYPMFGRLGIGNGHNNATDSWNVVVRPVFPAFQTTTGDLISLNGFENRYPEFPPAADRLKYVDFVGSGNILIQGYPILNQTDYLLGRMNDVTGGVHGMLGSTTEFTYVIDTIDSPLGSVGNVEHSAVFVSPVGLLSSGVYRLGLRNSKANYPETAVESGVISQWPIPKDITSDVDATFSNYYGYECFDSCFWVTDEAPKTGGFGAGASGLAVVSPFTGRTLWLRNAIDTPIGTISNFAGTQDAYWNLHCRSIQRIGTNNIKRILQNARSVTPVDVNNIDADIDVATFNDTLDSVATTTITLRIPRIVGGADEVVVLDMVFDGTSYFIVFRDGNALEPAWIIETDSSFSQTGRYEFSNSSERITKLGYISDGTGGSQRLVTYMRTNNFFLSDDLGIRPITMGNPPTFGTEKAIDVSTHIDGTITDAEILYLLEISGETEVDDGVYALIRVDTDATLNTLYIARIEEETSTWSIQGLWPLIRTNNASYNPFARGMGMLFMPVN